MHRVLVGFNAPPDQRAVIEETLGDAVAVSYLPDIDEGDRLDAIAAAEVLFVWVPARELGSDGLGRIPDKALVQLLSAGAEHVPYEDLPQGVMVASNVGAYAEPMAEHTLAMILALAKHIVPLHVKLREGVFDQKTRTTALKGGVCAILGYGGIGKEVARLARSFGMEIHAINTSGRTDDEVSFCGTIDDLETVLTAADVAVICLPLTRTTENLIGKRELQWMKPDAILVNVARAAIIREGDLYEHLAGNPDFRAGIDAWWVEPLFHGEFRTDYPLLDLPNVLGSPHNSPLTPGSLTDAAGVAAENVARFLAGEPISGIVDPADYV